MKDEPKNGTQVVNAWLATTSIKFASNEIVELRSLMAAIDALLNRADKTFTWTDELPTEPGHYVTIRAEAPRFPILFHVYREKGVLVAAYRCDVRPVSERTGRRWLRLPKDNERV